MPAPSVDVAVRGGCRYVVVISKHHDGFCIWPSDYSVFDTDRIAFQRDILRELGDEYRRRGLLFGIYYSIADIDYCGWKAMLGADELIAMFSRTLCGGGNLLVNIGPKPDGTMPEEQAARLYELTAWINGNAEAVYGTRGGPLRQTDALGCTHRGDKLYLHVRDRQARSLRLDLPEGCAVRAAKVLSTGRKASFTQRG